MNGRFHASAPQAGGEDSRVRPLPSVLRRRRGRFAVGLVLLAGLVLPACGPAKTTSAGAVPASPSAALLPWSQLDVLSDPRTAVGPTTARVAVSDLAPVTDAVRPVLPATVTDTQGTSVTVRSTDRILALDLYGSLAATVHGLGLGDHLVGRDTSTTFPAARDLPLVTQNGHQLSAEAILALHPTVLITDTTLGPWDVVLQIRNAGVPVVVVDSRRTLATVDTLISEVSAALGVQAEGKQLEAQVTQQINAEIAQVKQVVPADPTRRPRVIFLYARGQAGVYYLFGKGSGADSLISAVGAVDVASDSGIQGFTPLNAEALAKSRPDAIVMMSQGLESVGGVDGALKLPGVAQTPAGQHRRIIDMDDSQVLSFGPLTPQVVDALARALYAPGSGS